MVDEAALFRRPFNDLFPSLSEILEEPENVCLRSDPKGFILITEDLSSEYESLAANLELVSLAAPFEDFGCQDFDFIVFDRDLGIIGVLESESSLESS